MVTFEELVKTVEQLSKEERDDLRRILREKQEQEILETSKAALKEYEKGKTISLNSSEEIISFFKNLAKDDN